MSHLPLPALLRAFRSFCQAYSFQFADFELPVTPSKDVLGFTNSAEQAAAFEVIGQTGNGSLIAFWQEPRRSVDEMPVVWLDSEGVPVAVFANSFAEFLSLLPFGTDLIRSIVSACDFSQSNNDPNLTLASAAQIHPAEVIAEMWEFNKSVDPEQPAYVEWLTETVGLTVAEQPIAVIEQAFQSHASVRHWLGWS